jgi:hypothetical protein
MASVNCSDKEQITSSGFDLGAVSRETRRASFRLAPGVAKALPTVTMSNRLAKCLWKVTAQPVSGPERGHASLTLDLTVFQAPDEEGTIVNYMGPGINNVLYYEREACTLTSIDSADSKRCVRL